MRIFLFFFLGFGGLGDVQLVTLYSLTCFFLFNDLLIYLEILFLSYLLSLSMFYVIAFVWYSSTACSVFCSFNWYYFSLLADSADRSYCLLSRWSPSRPLISVALSRVCTWVSVVCMWDVGMFVVTSSGDQTIFSLTQLSATQLSMTFAEHFTK